MSEQNSIDNNNNSFNDQQDYQDYEDNTNTDYYDQSFIIDKFTANDINQQFQEYQNALEREDPNDVYRPNFDKLTPGRGGFIPAKRDGVEEQKEEIDDPSIKDEEMSDISVLGSKGVNSPIDPRNEFLFDLMVNENKSDTVALPQPLDPKLKVPSKRHPRGHQLFNDEEEGKIEEQTGWSTQNIKKKPQKNFNELRKDFNTSSSSFNSFSNGVTNIQREKQNIQQQHPHSSLSSSSTPSVNSNKPNDSVEALQERLSKLQQYGNNNNNNNTIEPIKNNTLQNQSNVTTDPLKTPSSNVNNNNNLSTGGNVEHIKKKPSMFTELLKQYQAKSTNSITNQDFAKFPTQQNTDGNNNNGKQNIDSFQPPFPSNSTNSSFNDIHSPSQQHQQQRNPQQYQQQNYSERNGQNSNHHPQQQQPYYNNNNNHYQHQQQTSSMRDYNRDETPQERKDKKWLLDRIRYYKSLGYEPLEEVTMQHSYAEIAQEYDSLKCFVETIQNRKKYEKFLTSIPSCIGMAKDTVFQNHPIAKKVNLDVLTKEWPNFIKDQAYYIDQIAINQNKKGGGTGMFGPKSNPLVSMGMSFMPILIGTVFGENAVTMLRSFNVLGSNESNVGENPKVQKYLDNNLQQQSQQQQPFSKINQLNQTTQNQQPTNNPSYQNYVNLQQQFQQTQQQQPNQNFQQYQQQPQQQNTMYTPNIVSSTPMMNTNMYTNQLSNTPFMNNNTGIQTPTMYPQNLQQQQQFTPVMNQMNPMMTPQQQQQQQIPMTPNQNINSQPSTPHPSITNGRQKRIIPDMTPK